MSQKELVKLFENRNVRVVWDDEKQEWYFSVVDVCGVLTDSVNPTDYLKKMRKRDPELNVFMGTNCPQVLMTTEISKVENPKGYSQNANVAKRGGHVAKAARTNLEAQIGRSVVSPLNAKDYFKSIEDKDDKDDK